MCPSISEITTGLFIGDYLCTYDPPTLQDNRITAVISLVNAPEVLWSRPKFTDIVTPERHLWIECLDSPTQDLLTYMSRICDFIDQMLTPTQCLFAPPSIQSQNLELYYDTSVPSRSSGAVLVHCSRGISRSATVIIAYLMRKQHKDCESALAEVRAKRKRAKPNENFMRQLKVWEEVEYQIWEDEAKEIPKTAYKVFLERRAAYLKAKGLTGDERCYPQDL